MAEEIARALEAEGHSVRLVRAKAALKERLEGDMLFLGSPTRIGSMTGRMKKFLKRMDPGPWRDRPVATFDTEMQDVMEKDGASAAAKMRDIARSRGLTVHLPVLKVGVAGVKGPLSPGSERAVDAHVSEFLRAT